MVGPPTEAILADQCQCVYCCKLCSTTSVDGQQIKLMHAQAEEEAAWAAAQKEAEIRRLAEEERRRKAERTVRKPLEALLL